MKINLMIAILMTAILIAVLPVVSATAVTLIAPAAGNNETGTMIVNCTTDMDGALNATLWYNASGGVAGTMHATVIAVNGSTDDPEFYNAAWTISGLTDATAYNLTCMVINKTAVAASVRYSTGVIGITFDSTEPICDVEVDHKHLAWKGIQQVEWTSSDLLSLISTAVTIDGPDDQTTLSYTDANRDLTLTSQDTKYLGDWTVTITGTDRSENTCTAISTFKTYLPDALPDEVAEPRISTGMLVLLGIAAIVIYFAFIKKK